MDEHMFLKLFPWKNILRFGCKEKLSLRFIGPFKVVERIGPITYRLKLPYKLDKINDVFHVSMLRKCYTNPTHVVAANEVELWPDLTYKKEPVKIIACEVKFLWNKRIPLVNVVAKPQDQQSYLGNIGINETIIPSTVCS